MDDEDAVEPLVGIVAARDKLGHRPAGAAQPAPQDKHCGTCAAMAAGGQWLFL